MSENFENKASLTPVKNFSQAGADKLREMTENSETYIEFLKFQGRVFKHNTSVALEFFTQKPETKFIATRNQWEASQRTIAQGSEAIRFVDKNGKYTDFYDFSQVEETEPPHQWTINSKNATTIKSMLNIPEQSTLINGIVNTTLKPANITACMSALSISPKDYKDFSKSYLNAVQLVIAGRLEVGGNNFKIPSDLTALQLLKTDEQKLAFLTHTANVARECLMKIEKSAQNIEIQERNERNDLREMENTYRQGENFSSGRGVTNNTTGTVGEQSDRSQSNENGRETGLGNNSESEERKEHEMVSGIQNENGEQSGVLVQVRPDMWTLQSEHGGVRTIDGGRTDRELRTPMDEVYGGTLSTSGGTDEIVSQVSDGSTFSGQVGMGVQGATGGTIRGTESTSDHFRGDTEMGTGKDVPLGQHSDEGNSLSTSDRSINDKLNSVFSTTETKETSTNSADVFVLDEDVQLSDEEQLVIITTEISEKEALVTSLIKEKEYAKATEVLRELTELNQKSIELKDKIQQLEITNDDIQILRDIRPVRKSVQNMLEHEVAQTQKFEKLLQSEMGEKSAYEMRKGNDEWKNDDSRTVNVVEVQQQNIPKNLPDIRRNNNIARGTFKNKDTDIDIIFSKRSIEEVISKAIQEDKRKFPVDARISALYQMQELIENSVCFDSQISEYDALTSKNKSPNTLFMHRMYGVVKYNGNAYLARLSVEESYCTDKDNKFTGTSKRIYNLKDMKITPVEANRIFSPAVSNKNDTEDTSTSVITVSIPQLYALVKKYDQSFYENPTAPGREEREAELYVQAEYKDSISTLESTSDEMITIETDKQISDYATAHNIKNKEDAKSALENQVERQLKFFDDDSENNDFAEKIKNAFSEVTSNRTFNEKQLKYLERLQNFAIKNNISKNLVDSAFESSTAFRSAYGNKRLLSKNVFGLRLGNLENDLDIALKKQFSKKKVIENTDNQNTSVEDNEVRTSDDIEIGDKYRYKNREYTVVSMQGVYPDDIGISYDEKLSNGTAYAITENVNKNRLHSEGIYLGKDVKSPEIIENSMETKEEATENTDFYKIYQLKDGEEYHYNRFESYENNKNANLNKDDYNLVYEGNWSDLEGISAEEKLNSLWHKFNADSKPEDFTGHSLSMSDVIVVGNESIQTAYYTDRYGFTDMPEFFREKELENEISEQQNHDKSISDKNAEIVQNIEVGDEVTLQGEVYVVKSINGSFMMSMDRKDFDEISIGVANRSFIGDWKNQLVAEAKNSLISVVKSDSEKEMEDAESETNSDKELWDVRITRARNVSDGIATHLSESKKKDDKSYVYGTYSSYEEAAQMLAELRKDFENNPSLKSEYFNKCPYYEREVIKNMDIKLDNESYRVVDVDKLLNKVELAKSDNTSRIETYENISNIVNVSEIKYELTEQEKLFSESDICSLVTKGVLANDEIESLSYPLFEDSYTEKHKASEKSIYGSGLKEPELYALVDKMKNGEDIRKAFAEKLIGKPTENSFLYENKFYDFAIKSDDNKLIASFGNVQREVSYEEIGQHLLDRIENEYKDISSYRTMEEAFEKLRKKHDFSLNQLKFINHIERSLSMNKGYNNIDESLTAILDSPEFTNNYGTIDSMESLMDDKLKNIISELKSYISGEDSKDKTPELRQVLNDFSNKYGLGELNIESNRYNWTLYEKFEDGTEFTLGEITNPEYEIPFTPKNLETALQTFEKELQYRNQTVSEVYSRKSQLEKHGGISTLPKVQDNLPEITYASKPSEKINNNITAIREMIRLEDAEKNNNELYNVDGYYSKEASEKRLRQYCGWGGLSQLFDENFKPYSYQRDELKRLLTPEEYKEARASTLNAHYTSQTIIDAMYKAVQNMDLLRDCRILEPSCGTGNFISRLPHKFNEAEIVGVEIDSITAKIAKNINRNNPNVTIIESGFENTNLKNNSFDLAIGNVPFGDYNLNDPDYVQDWRIHDAFFRKALDKVAEGGIVAFVTSTGTMDKSSPKVREYLAERAELIGAVRLPEGAFSDAGTKVSSDIIFLKKRDVPLQSNEPKPDWCYTIPNQDGLKINSYFVNNPQMMLGTMKKTTFQDRLTCVPFEGADLEKQLNEAIKNLNAKITITKREKAILEKRGTIEAWGKNFTYQPKDGKIYFRQGDEMNEVKCSKTELKQLEALCEIRTATRNLIDMQKTSVSDDELLPIREKLNKLYDEYKTEYSELSSKRVNKIFGSDSDYPILKSLETLNKETGKYEKSDIFFKRTVNPSVDIKTAENVEEALQISLDRKGKPDISYMAILLDEKYPDMPTSKVAEQVCNELLEKGHIFIDPEKQIPDKPFSGVVERSEYLSGNVRMKLTIAEEFAKSNPEYKHNVAELEKVIPEDIKAEEIVVQMGCKWIEPEDYTAFLEHLSGRSTYNSRKCDVSYSTVTGEFDILNAGSKKELNLNETTTYGTADYNMYQLAEKIMNQRRIVVMREKPHPKDSSKTVTRTDPKATKIALEKAKLIRAEFVKWIFEDSERKAKYERKYNDIFNSIVGREYDGSHLTFSGITTLNNFTLRPHQKNCVARAIYGGNTLAAHVVGAGKSAVICASVMKKKELGLIDKACVVVPKALTEQTANEWRKIYPDAKLLTVTNDDLSNENKRNLFTARVATGSYDAVILSQEQFEKIPMSKQYRVNFMKKELDALEDMLREKKIESKGKKDYSVKAIEKAKKRLQVKVEKLTDPKSASKAKDDLLEFEQLGFDYLVCDEAHAYKNGFVTTKMTNVAGVTTRPSGRAEDMQMKTDYFNEELGQGHILFATGTPYASPYQH